jgi:predicted DNA-binding protein
MVPKEDDNRVHELSGRIVAESDERLNSLSKGVYIHKGKKYIIK